LTLAAVGVADRAALVVQQSVGCVRSAVRMKRVLERDRGMHASALTVVVNRYQRSSAVTEEDIRRALGCGPPLLVPNDYKIAHESCDTGVPLIEVAGRAPLTKSIAALAASLVGREPLPPRSLFARALPLLSRRLS
jgi:pilus assembly protein CpaE